jgi:chemotaxis protein histidine kinase CheA
MEGYLYLRNNKADLDPTSQAPKWSKRFCSMVVDPKRGPFFVARKRIEEDYGKHESIEAHVPFATSVVKLHNYTVVVEEDNSAGSSAEVGGIIRLTHDTLDAVELRDKSLERAKKWAVAIKSTLKAWDVCPPTPRKGGSRSPTRNNENRLNSNNNSGTPTKAKKSLVWDKNVTSNGKKNSADYRATMAKSSNDQAVKSAADALLAGDQLKDDQQENDYKESLKAKAQSQVLLMDSKRRFLEEKRLAEKEVQRRRQREEDEESAQKEMSQLLAEAEKRQAEKQRLLEESQLQTEELQRKALEAAKRAEDMISKNEAEMQKLLLEANRKKALAEQISQERADEERQREIQAEMMRQLEEQRRERERLEREEAARRREQEEIEALKKALEKKIQGYSDHNNSSGGKHYHYGGGMTTSWVLIVAVAVAAALGGLLSGHPYATSALHSIKGSVLRYSPYNSGGSNRPTYLYAASYLPSGAGGGGHKVVGGHDISRGLPSTTSYFHGGSSGSKDGGGMDVKEFLQVAPRDEVVAALASLAESRDFELQQAKTGGGNGGDGVAMESSSSSSSRGDRGQMHKHGAFPNVFKSLLLAITSPLRLLSLFIKKLF